MTCTHTGVCTHEHSLPPTFCSLGGQGTWRSYLPFYPWHIVGTWKRLCEELDETRIQQSSSVHIAGSSLNSNFCSRFPSPRGSLRLCHILRDCLLTCVTPTLVALGVFSIPYQTCPPRPPPTSCSTSDQGLLGRRGPPPVNVGAPGRSPTPYQTGSSPISP